ARPFDDGTDRVLGYRAVIGGQLGRIGRWQRRRGGVPIEEPVERRTHLTVVRSRAFVDLVRVRRLDQLDRVQVAPLPQQRRETLAERQRGDGLVIVDRRERNLAGLRRSRRSEAQGADGARNPPRTHGPPPLAVV